jgi:uncharacterized protein
VDTTKRGFARMPPEEQRRIASLGGRAVQDKGLAPRFDEEKARRAGKKGGETTSRDRDHMRAIGRRGGRRSADKRKKEKR